MMVANAAVQERQEPLRQLYRRRPEAAMIHKRVRTGPADGRDPFHGAAVPENQADPERGYGVAWAFGIDQSVGGLHDLPNPGELLCAALATCQDGLIRMLAGSLGVALEHLEVEVTGDVDVRGTLNLDPSVPVGFQSLAMSVRMRAAPGTPSRLLERLRIGAERLCVNLETLRHGVPVETRYEIATADAAQGGS
jgi:uncharacterized OsmC-like protein